MNQTTKTGLFIIGCFLYASLLLSQVDGHDSQRPHTHADYVVVSTQAMSALSGLTNDVQTNVNLQTVLDSLVGAQVPTATNVTMNTNDFVAAAPSNRTVQDFLNWADLNWLTNLSPTNTYPTDKQASNWFLSSGTTLDYIPASGGNVSNKHMAANSVRGSNLIGGVIGNREMSGDAVYPSNMYDSASYMKASGQTYAASTFNFVNVGSTQRTLIGTTLLSRATAVQMHFYIDQSSVTGLQTSADRIYAATIGVQFSGNGTSFSNELRTGAQITKLNSLGPDQYGNIPGCLSFTVPPNHYYWVYATAQSTNLAQESWTLAYQRTLMSQ